MADGTERENIEGISIDEFMGGSGDSSSEGESGGSSIEGAIDDVFNIDDINLDDISLADLMIDDFDDDNDNVDGTADNEVLQDAEPVAEAAEEGVSEEDVVQAKQDIPDNEPEQSGDTRPDAETEQPDDAQPDVEPEQSGDAQFDAEPEQIDDMQPDSVQKQPESTQPEPESVQEESEGPGEPESAEDSGQSETAASVEEVFEKPDTWVDDIDENEIDEDDIDLMQLLTGGDDDDDDFELLEVEEPSPQENQDNPKGKEDSVSDEESSGLKRKSKKGNVFADPLSVLSDDSDNEDVGVDDVPVILENVKEKSKKKKKKSGKGIGIGKFFSNIVDEKELQKAEKEKKDAELAEKKKADDEEKKQKLAEEKASKKEEQKLAKAQLKESKKQEKEAKKRAKKEAKELRKLEEETEIEGRINKVGAAIVFAVIGCMAILLYVGTRKFSYSSSVSNASSYFENGRYQEAYNELAGADLKEEDMPLYNKVVTIMYVYKQLDAYDAYYKAARYPQALDSLLKGIREYEKYMPDAIEFDITDNFDSIKNQIIGELSAEYAITEDMAREINSLTDSAEYSKRVYELAQNLSSNYY